MNDTRQTISLVHAYRNTEPFQLWTLDGMLIKTFRFLTGALGWANENGYVVKGFEY